MKRKYEKKVLPLFILILLFTIVLVGCDYFTGPAGKDGLDGIDGVDGGNVPGGFLDVFVYSGSLEQGAQVRIVFDPDTTILNGNETIEIIPLADYIEIGSINEPLSWHAPEVVPGSYYIYAWIDYEGDGLIDTLQTSEGTFSVFGSFSIDTAGTPWIINDSLNRPNYTFFDDFAPQVDFTLQEPA